LFRQRLVKLATLATRHAIPAIYPIPQFAEVGGLMSYGTSYLDVFRQAGAYVGRILKGTKRGLAGPATDQIRVRY